MLEVIVHLLPTNPCNGGWPLFFIGPSIRILDYKDSTLRFTNLLNLSNC